MPPVTTTRPMTEEERALLVREPVRLVGWWTGIVSALCGFLLTFLVVSLPAPWIGFAVAARAALAAAILASVAWYVWVQYRARRALSADVAGTAREVAAGFVRSTVYRITDAVAVEEAEDEGLSYYLLLDEGRTLFLSGQYLYEPEGAGFPWESFEVVRVASGTWVLRVVPLGPPLTPSYTRPPFTDEELSPGGIPDDGAIDRRDFAALKRQP
jgi:hypothetical protein